MRREFIRMQVRTTGQGARIHLSIGRFRIEGVAEEEVDLYVSRIPGNPDAHPKLNPAGFKDVVIGVPRLN